MTSFKTFFLEYYKGNPILNPKMVNGKDPNRALTGQRKHITSIRKEEEYADPLVKSVALGHANEQLVPYKRLMKILSIYKIDPQTGVKTLGNSKVEVVLDYGSDGRLMGKLRKRVKNVM